VPGDDREWVAAAGANGFYLSYHAIGAGDEIIVNQGQVVAGQPTTAQTYDAINPARANSDEPVLRPTARRSLPRQHAVRKLRQGLVIVCLGLMVIMTRMVAGSPVRRSPAQPRTW
jgi:hypothetical protein